MSQKRFTGAKIVIFGSSGVGKTAFAVRYLTKRYIGDYDRDKEMMYTHKPNSTRDDIVLEILDTGSKSAPDTLERHIKWADGFVFIYSITDKPSLEYLTTVKDVLDRVKGQGHEAPLVLVGNKSDLISARVITEDEGQDIATQYDCPNFEISVAEGAEGVMEVMDELLCLLKRDFVKSVSNANMASIDKPKSKLFSMKKAFKKRINRSHSDTF